MGRFWALTLVVLWMCMKSEASVDSQWRGTEYEEVPQENHVEKKDAPTGDGEECVSSEVLIVMEMELAMLQWELQNLTKQIKELKPSRAMFYGKMSAKDPSPKEIFKYDQVVTEVGGGYNQQDGKYSCPVSGWYLVSYSVFGYVMRYDTKFTSGASLKKDGVYINMASSSNYFSMDQSSWLNMQAATTAVIYCSEGEKLWLEGADTSSNRATNTDFVVALLQKD